MATAMADMVNMAKKTNNHGLLLLLLLPAGAWAGDWKFTPQFTVNERYSDNVALSTANPESSFLTEITPGFKLSRQGARGNLAVDYGLQGLFYTHDSGANRFNNQLAATLKSELVEESFYLDATARISQQNINLTGATGTSNYNITGNSSEVRTLSLVPSWRARFGSQALLDVRWQLTYSDSDNGAIANTAGNALTLSLKSGSAVNRFPWSVAYKLQSNDGNAASDRNSSLTGSLGYIVSPKVRLTLSAGKDSNNGTTTAFNQASGGFWNLGLNWDPFTRTNLGVTLGHRYSGNSYGVDFSHRTRKTTWALRYSEDILQLYEQITGSDVYLCNGIQVSVPAGSLPDSASCSTPILINRFAGPTQLANDISLNKSLTGAATYQAGKSTFSLSLNSSRRQQLSSGVSDDSRGIGASWIFRLSPRLTSTLSMASSHANTVGGQSDDWTMFWLLSRQLAQKTTGSVEVRRVERDSGSTTGPYRENSVSARVNMSF